MVDTIRCGLSMVNWGTCPIPTGPSAQKRGCKWLQYATAIAFGSQLIYMGLSENSVPLNPVWFCWSLSLWKMAISLGILTQHFQTNPNINICCFVLRAAKLFVVVVRHDGLPSVVCNAGFNEPARSGSSSVHLPLQWWWKPVKHYDGHLKWYDKDWHKVCLAWFLYVHAINCRLSNYKSQRPQRPDFVLRQLSKWRFLFVQMRGQLVILFWSQNLFPLLMKHEKNHWSPNIVLHSSSFKMSLSLSDFQEYPKNNPFLSIVTLW